MMDVVVWTWSLIFAGLYLIIGSFDEGKNKPW